MREEGENEKENRAHTYVVSEFIYPGLGNKLPFFNMKVHMKNFS